MKKDFRERPKIFLGIIIFCGYLLSVMTLFGRINPISIAFIGGLSGADCLAAFVGASVGFVTRGDFTQAVPFIISAAVVCVLRIILSRSKSTAADIGSSVLCGSAVLLTNAIITDKPSELLTVFVLGVVSGVSCYSFSSFRKKFKKGIGPAALNPVKMIPYALTAVFLLAAMSGLSYGIFNLGAVVSSLLVLISAYRFRFGGGSLAGIICALGLAASDNGLAFAGIAMAAGAVMGSVVAPKGRLPLAAAFILTTALSGAFFGMDRTMLAFMADTVIGSVIFAALPLKEIMGIFVGRSLPGKFNDSPTEVFAGRLELVGNTMGELRYAVEKTAEALDESTDRDITNVYNSACDKVCRNCRFNMKCWGEEYNDSVRLMNGFLRSLRKGESLTPDNFSGALGLRCQRKQQLCDSINKKYDDFTAAGQMSRRIKEMRGILTKQLENTEKLFNSISEEFGRNVSYNSEAAFKTERLLERCGLAYPKAAAKMCDGNMIIEAYGSGELSCTAEELGDMLIDTLQREFDLPCILQFGKKVRVTAFERAEYGVKSAVCQLSRKKDTVNGDYVTGCIDGSGYYYSIVSDGMGSGTRARIDSAFACGLLTKLLESGIGVEAAIDMLNTSLMVKSSDESFATLDVCRVDLYTGKTTIYKAGGADSFVRSGKTVTKIHGTGLPVGVSGNASVSSHSFIVGEDDVIIMTSDGADLSEKWLEQAFSKDSGGNVEELVKSVAGAARFNCEKGKEDDISVVAIQIKK